jgi:cyanate permease
MATIQGVNFKAVATTVPAFTYDLIPFDFGGKALAEMTIVVDSTLAVAQVNLPEIISSATPPAYSFGGVYGTTIKIIAATGATNDVVINASGSDTIGSLSTITLSTDGANAVFTIVTDNDWSVIVSA